MQSPHRRGVLATRTLPAGGASGDSAETRRRFGRNGVAAEAKMVSKLESTCKRQAEGFFGSCEKKIPVLPWKAPYCEENECFAM